MRPPVAVEISERWLKVVVAKPATRPPRLLACVVKPIAGFSDGQITQTVQQVVRELKLKARPVTVSFPRCLVTLRNLHLPSQDPREIAQMIDLNVTRMVPYRKEEVVSSYRLLGADDIGYTKVMLAIVHRDLVKRQAGILESAGLSIERILLSSHGVWQWAAARHKSEMTAQELFLLVDADATFLDCIICSREQALFSRSIALQADQPVREEGMSKLIGEVSQSLEVFQSEETNKRPIKAFLSGAAGSLEPLKQAIGRDLKLPVVSVSPPSILPPKGKGARPAEPPPTVSLTAVAELATDQGEQLMSFVLPEMQIKQSLRQKTRELVLLGSLSASLVTLLIGIGMSRVYRHQAYLSQLQARNAAITQEIGELVTQSKRLELIKESLRLRGLPLRYLAELQQLVPQDIALEFVSVDERQRGVIRGQALQLSHVFAFISTLEQSASVEHVETKYTRRKRSRDKDTTEFELALQYRP